MMKLMDGSGALKHKNVKNNAVNTAKFIVGKTIIAMKTKICAVKLQHLTVNTQILAQRLSTVANTIMKSMMFTAQSQISVKMNASAVIMVPRLVSVSVEATMLTPPAMIPMDKNAVMATGVIWPLHV